MFSPRKVGAAFLVLGLISLAAAPAQACCGLFGGKCCGASTAYYAPVAPVVAAYAPAPCAPACSPCGGGACAPYSVGYAPAPCNSCQTVNYVPQVSYRTVYYSAPVVAYSPVAACGPCGQTTVMRPVTTYVTQARLVPYTSYRPVVAAMPVAAPVTAAYYAPAAPAAAPCCAAGYRSAPAPVVTTAMPVGAPGAVVPSLQPTPAAVAPPLQAPSLPPASAPSTVAPSSTFDPSPAPGPSDPQSRIVLPPRGEAGAPRALDPEDRTTAVPLRQAWTVRNASAISPVKAAAPTQDDGGWRSAR